MQADSLPTGLSGKLRRIGQEPTCNEGDLGSILGLGREWQPTPVFSPEDTHGQRNLAGYGLWVAKSQTQLSD